MNAPAEDMFSFQVESHSFLQKIYTGYFTFFLAYKMVKCELQKYVL